MKKSYFSILLGNTQFCGISDLGICIILKICTCIMQFGSSSTQASIVLVRFTSLYNFKDDHVRGYSEKSGRLIIGDFTPFEQGVRTCR